MENELIEVQEANAKKAAEQAKFDAKAEWKGHTQAARITELENTNRLLCRDLDEAQRAIEVLRGEGK